MSYLLKIVEGPMKGAEIALVSGTRVKVGSADSCDVVVADASLPDVAFELDVTDSAVTLILPAGDAKTMHPFEIQSFGTTEVAIGPAEGVWEPLTRPAPAAEEKKPEEAAPAAEEEKKPEESAPAEEAPAEGAAEETAADGGEEKSGHGCLFGVVLLLSVLALAVMLAALWFWPHARPYALKVSDKAALVDPWADRVGALRSKWSFGKKDAVEQARAEKKLALGDLAAQNGLKLERKDGRPLLSGNLKLRTERMAVRALALATDRRCQLDLTDDESLKEAADALLFLLTEGRVKVAAATNRVVELRGFAPTTADLSRLIRGLSADVPAIAKIVSAGVKTGDVRTKPLKNKVAPVALTSRTPSIPLPVEAGVAKNKTPGGPPAAKTLPQRDAEFALRLQAASNAVAAANLAASNAVAEVVQKEAVLAERMLAANLAASNAVSSAISQRDVELAEQLQAASNAVAAAAVAASNAVAAANLAASNAVAMAVAASNAAASNAVAEANAEAANAVAAANAAASNAVAAANAEASNAVAKVQAEKAELIGRLAAKLSAAQPAAEERELVEMKAPNGTFIGLPRGKSPRNYPTIAGILTVPYPCVVLANGMRCVYGAQLGGAAIVEINADSVLLQDEDVLFAWIP